MTKQNPAFFLIFACLFEMLRRRKRREAKRPGLQQGSIAAFDQRCYFKNKSCKWL
jgi:hypothetical protein